MFLQISRKGTAWKTVNVFCAVLVTWSMTGCGVIESLERDGGKPVEPPVDKFDFMQDNYTFIHHLSKAIRLRMIRCLVK